MTEDEQIAHEHAILRQGYESRKTYQFTKKQCPYDHTTEEYQLWLEGWEDADYMIRHMNKE